MKHQLTSQEVVLSAKVAIPAIFGTLILFFFATGCVGLFRAYSSYATRHDYEDRELEILNYRWSPNASSEDPKRIEGVIHPEGITVQTYDDAVSLLHLNNSTSLVQMAPEESVVVGQRVNVKYFVGKLENRRWWHPPEIHNTQPNEADWVAKVASLTFGSGLAAVGCFYYSYRSNQAFQQLTRRKRR